MDQSGLSEYLLLGYHLTFLTCLLCDATLRPPTSRLQRLRDILAEHDRLDLYEEAVAIVGDRDGPADQVERLLREGTEAFELAVQVRRSPHPFQHKLNPHQRTYFVEKCRSLITAGLMDPAVGWLLAYYVAAIGVILTDGPEDVKPLYTGRRNRLLHLLSIEKAQARAERFARIERLDEHVFGLVDAIIEGNPRVTD
jgi:hypothetical protein